MGRLENIYLSVTTAADGTGSKSATKAVFGYLYAVEMIDGTYDDNVDATLSYTSGISGTSFNVLVFANFNTDQLVYPRTLVHGDTDGAALTGTAGGDRAMPLVNGTLTLTIAQGGNVKTGGIIAYVIVND